MRGVKRVTTSAPSNTSRTRFGRVLIRTSTLMGRRLNQLEASILRSPRLAFVPTEYRKIGFQLVKLMLLLAAASVALFLAIAFLALWVVAALPVSTDRQPRIHEVDHLKHPLKYPEMYDDNGAPR